LLDAASRFARAQLSSVSSAAAAASAAAVLVAAGRVGLLGARFEVHVHDHAHGFFPGGNAAVGQMDLFAPFVVVRPVQLVGQALGADPLAGNAFFIDVQHVVFLGGGYGLRRRPRFAASIAIATTAAPTTAPPSASAIAFVSVGRSAFAFAGSLGGIGFGPIHDFAAILDVALEAILDLVVFTRRSRLAADCTGRRRFTIAIALAVAVASSAAAATASTTTTPRFAFFAFRARRAPTFRPIRRTGLVRLDARRRSGRFGALLVAALIAVFGPTVVAARPTMLVARLAAGLGTELATGRLDARRLGLFGLGGLRRRRSRGRRRRQHRSDERRRRIGSRLFLAAKAQPRGQVVPAALLRRRGRRRGGRGLDHRRLRRLGTNGPRVRLRHVGP
jgi:hypothetical protein